MHIGVYSFMKRFFCGLFLLLALVGCDAHHLGTPNLEGNIRVEECARGNEFFPTPAQLPLESPIMEQGYEYVLKTMHESSLFACAPRPRPVVFRLYWDRSRMTKPVARITLGNDGYATVAMKLFNRECDPPPPHRPDGACPSATKETVLKLDRQQTAQVFSVMRRVPWRDETLLLRGWDSEDGADWVFEMRDGSTYRFADFREPPPELVKFTHQIFWQWTGYLPEEEEIIFDHDYGKAGGR